MKELINKMIVNRLIEKGKTVSCMESCTGGMLANEITNVEGASQAFSLGVVTYSNEEKIRHGINKKTIDEYTVYSNEIAGEMAKCIAIEASSSFGVGITGELGMPDINNKSDNINMVYFAIFDKEQNKVYNYQIETKGKNRYEKKIFVVTHVFEELSRIIQM